MTITTHQCVDEAAQKISAARALDGRPLNPFLFPKQTNSSTRFTSGGTLWHHHSNPYS
jgi:hypothetical protein